MKTAIFCDFDGTVSRRDVGYNLFRHFSGGRNEELVPLWQGCQISTRECLTREAAMVTASPDEIYRFLDGFELSPGFASFADRCRRQGIDLTILSDGLDFYIHHVLRREGLSEIPVIANHAELSDERVIISFPHDNRHCERCGSCKGERIEEYRRRRSDPVYVVFAGDGYSDVCALDQADLVFAKKDLERYCRSHDIPFTQYRDFVDVARQLVDRELLVDESGHTRDGEQP